MFLVASKADEMATIVAAELNLETTVALTEDAGGLLPAIWIVGAHVMGLNSPAILCNQILAIALLGGVDAIGHKARKGRYKLRLSELR